MVEHQYCAGSYRVLTWLANIIAPFFLLAIRILWGVLLIGAGVQKFGDINHTAALFAELGFPAAAFLAYIVAAVEVIAGAALILGFASRFFAFVVIVLLSVALFTAHQEATFNLIRDPVAFINQAPITFLLAAFTVFLFGPGVFSIDYLVEKIGCKKCS